jgi:hypothetical protein
MNIRSHTGRHHGPRRRPASPSQASERSGAPQAIRHCSVIVV